MPDLTLHFKSEAARQAFLDHLDRGYDLVTGGHYELEPKPWAKLTEATELWVKVYTAHYREID